ncbi:hypothetical protein ONE63_002313 [Megalurothrips usitatus]|uniref:Aminopeptidase N-like n=1 Tax=Megalurothrips usitatus TaxID=439358 RepID=A0AAV7XA63_9NEOP|nr:hypothetical protein ONE63_002313 [Megalurothrips usitatus]
MPAAARTGRLLLLALAFAAAADARPRGGAAFPVHSESRLPQSVKPTHYDIAISPDLETFKTFTGVVTIDLKTETDAAVLALHAASSLTDLDMKLYELSTGGTSGGTASEAAEVSFSYSFDIMREQISLALQKPMAWPKAYRLVIRYKGTLSEDGGGFYKSTYLQDGVTKIVAATRLDPYLAHHAFPCFNEPGFRATFRLSIVHPRDTHALSNTRAALVSRTSQEEKAPLRTTFEETPPMAPCSLAWVLSELPEAAGVGAVRTFARRDAVGDPGSLSALADALLARLAEYTATPPVLDTLDQVVLPVDVGEAAVGSWGLITYREQEVLSGGGKTSGARLDSLLSVAHQLSHQWFGNLVTADWWDHAWLSTSLAQLVQYTVLDQVRPELRLAGQMGVLETQRGLAADSGPGALPLTLPPGTPRLAYAEHGLVARTKGLSVLRMFQDLITPATFQKGVKDYLSKHKFSSCGPSALWSSLQGAAVEDGTAPAGVTLEEMAVAWTEVAGHPVVTAVRDYEAGTVTLTQSGVGDAAAPAWWVPVTLASKDGELARTLLSPEKPSVVADGPPSRDWLLLNPGQRGFYRVNYDVLNWLRLAKALESAPADQLPSEESRAMLVDDALALASAGALDFPVALRVVEGALVRERSPAPWLAFARHADKLATFFRGPDAAAERAFNTWVRFLVDGAYAELGFPRQGQDEEPLTQAQMRGVVATLACQAGHPRCAAAARQQYLQWHNGTGVDADALSLAVCHGVSGPWAKEDAFWHTESSIRRATTDAERAAVIGGLGCLSGQYRSQLLQTLLLSTDLGANDNSRLAWAALTSTHAGARVALENFAKEDVLTEFVKRFGEEFLGLVVADLAPRVTSPLLADALDAFVSIMYPGTPYVDDAKLVADQNMAWREAFFATAAEFMGGARAPDATILDSLMPMAYTVSLMTPDYSTGRRTQTDVPSVVEVTFSSATDTDMVSFHVGKNLLVEHLVVTDDQSDAIFELYGSEDLAAEDERRTHYDEAAEIMTVFLDAPMLADKTYYLEVRFYSESDPLTSDVTGGLFVKVLPDGLKTVTSTIMEPGLAHRVFPCFNKPRFTANFALKVAVPPQMDYVSITPAKSADADAGLNNWLLVEFEPTAALPVDLVAVALFDPMTTFTASRSAPPTTAAPGPAATAADAVTVRVRAEALQGHVDGAKAAHQALDLLLALESALGLACPTSALELVTVPGLQAGPVLSPGLSVVREGDVLTSAVSQTDHDLHTALTLANVLAHSFIGDYLSFDTKDALWLREGVAAVLEAKVVDQATGNKHGAVDRFGAFRQHRGLSLDARETALPLETDKVSDNTANKGAGLVRMLSAVIGESTFLSGLRRLFDGRRGPSKVSVGEVVQSLQQAADDAGLHLPASVADLVSSWTLQPGYPVVTVTRNYTAGTASLQQARFSPVAGGRRGADGVDGAATWLVPFNVAVGAAGVGGQSGQVQPALDRVLAERGAQVTVAVARPDAADDFLIVNADQAGFYRVNYDDRNWELLTRAAATDGIGAAQKAALLDDAVALCRAGLLDVEVALELLVAVTTAPTPTPTPTPTPSSSTSVLADPASTAPPAPAGPASWCAPCWLAARKALAELGPLAHGEKDIFWRFVAEKLTQRPLEALGWDQQAGEDWASGSLRAVVSELACSAYADACTDRAKEAGEDWTANTDLSSLGVDADVLAATICVKMRSPLVSVSDFTEVGLRLVAAEDASVRRAYITGRACVCTTSPGMCDVLLTTTADASGVDVSDVLPTFEAIVNNDGTDVGRVAAFVAANYKDMRERLGAELANAVLTVVAERVSDDSAADTLAALGREFPAEPAVSAAARLAASTAAWVRSARPQYRRWVYAQFGETPPEETTLAPAPTSASSTRKPGSSTSAGTSTTPGSPSTSSWKPTTTTKRPPKPTRGPTTPKPSAASSPAAASALMLLLLAMSTLVLQRRQT